MNYVMLMTNLNLSFDRYTVLENEPVPLERSTGDLKTNTYAFRLIQICCNNNKIILNVSLHYYALTIQL